MPRKPRPAHQGGAGESFRQPGCKPSRVSFRPVVARFSRARQGGEDDPRQPACTNRFPGRLAGLPGVGGRACRSACLGLRGERRAGRSRVHLRHPAQRNALCPARESHARRDRAGSLADRIGIARRDRRRARPRALPRTHGVQRLHPRPRRRDGQAARARGIGVRGRHQRIDQFREHDLQARPAPFRSQAARHRADADARDCRRVDPVARRDRSRTRGSARREARPRQLCTQGNRGRVGLRGSRRALHPAAADRDRRRAQGRRCRADRRALSPRLCPGERGAGGDRRHRHGTGRKHDPGTLRRLDGAARPARARGGPARPHATRRKRYLPRSRAVGTGDRDRPVSMGGPARHDRAATTTI